MNKERIEEILKIIQQGLDVRLLDDYHDFEIASVLKLISKEKRFELYQRIGLERSSEIFTYLEDVEEFLDELTLDKQADIIEKMDVDEAIDVLDELSEKKQQNIIDLIDDYKLIENLNLVKNYEKDLVGSLITNNLIKITNDLSVKDAMKEVIRQAEKNDNVSIIFVTDHNSKYLGLITLRDLIVQRATGSTKNIIKTSYPKLIASQKIADVLNDILDYELEIFPVLNEKEVLIGALTSFDINEALEESHSEDYLKLAALDETEDFEKSVRHSVKKRMPWLITLLFLGLLVSFVTSNFEGIVRSIPMIVFFQSLIVDMGGNSGTQSLAISITLLNDGELSSKKVKNILLKELKIGFLSGIILSFITVILVYLFIYITKTEIIIGSGFSVIEAFETSFVVGISLLISISLSTLVGALFPIMFHKLKIDPAVASGPFITTLNDLIGIVIYYILAYYFLIYLV